MVSSASGHWPVSSVLQASLAELRSWLAVSSGGCLGAATAKMQTPGKGCSPKSRLPLAFASTQASAYADESYIGRGNSVSYMKTSRIRQAVPRIARTATFRARCDGGGPEGDGPSLTGALAIGYFERAQPAAQRPRAQIGMRRPAPRSTCFIVSAGSSSATFGDEHNLEAHSKVQEGGTSHG